MGFQSLDLPPVLSTESLFTRAIPLGMQNMAFCRTPSNRIGIYNRYYWTLLLQLDFLCILFSKDHMSGIVNNTGLLSCSPASTGLGNLSVAMPKSRKVEVPILRFELPNRAGHKRSWRHSDVKPSDLNCPYKLPFLCKEELDFLRGIFKGKVRL
jgi:hypothetical protein